MRKLKKTAALFCAAALTLLPAVPAFADFDQSVLDGVVLLYSGAPDEKRRSCKEAVAVPVCRRPNSACRRLTAATVALL